MAAPATTSRVSSTDDIYDGVITDEPEFNKDWDGNWQHAVGEDDAGWTVEVLIPWHIASMRDAKGDTRTLKIYLDRVIGSTGERVAWPLASLERPRFLSDFAPIDVANYSQSLLAVTPYVSGLYDNVGESSDGDAGVDVFWKPNGQTQLTATVNPDFGQVESDDLVVNFDATETFISDKRPFFTENQGIFEFTHAVGLQPVAVHATRRRARGRWRGIGRHHRARSSSTAASARPSTECSPPTKRRRRPHVRCAARGPRFRDAESRIHGDQCRAPVSRSRGHRARPRSQLAAHRALERTHARVRQRHRAGGRRHQRYRRHGLGRLRDGSRLAPAVDRHAFRQRPADQRRRLSLAQQHQLPALAGESPLHRPAGDVALLVEGLALARSAPTTTITGSC